MPEKRKTLRDFMTEKPLALKDDSTAADAAREMRESDVGTILVTGKDGGLRGIVTDRDLVVRCMADGTDPRKFSLEKLCSSEVVHLPPDAGLDEAVSMMREKAIRRVPIVDGKTPVGIVSIGDLAVELDGESALGQISAAPPNR